MLLDSEQKSELMDEKKMKQLMMSLHNSKPHKQKQETQTMHINSSNLFSVKKPIYPSFNIISLASLADPNVTVPINQLALLNSRINTYFKVIKKQQYGLIKTEQKIDFKDNQIILIE